MPNMMPKVVSLRKAWPNLSIQVDGGLSPSTIDVAAQAGANVIVAGSAVFKKGLDPRKPIVTMRRSVEKYGNGKSDEELTPYPPHDAIAFIPPLVVTATLYALGQFLNK